VNEGPGAASTGEAGTAVPRTEAIMTVPAAISMRRAVFHRYITGMSESFLRELRTGEGARIVTAERTRKVASYWSVAARATDAPRDKAARMFRLC
jgi:hypothetical protein